MRRPFGGLLLLTAVLATAAALALLARVLIDRGAVDPMGPATVVAGLLPGLVAATAALVVLTLVFRGAARAAANKRLPVDLRRIETAVAAVAGIVVAVALAGDLGGALVGIGIVGFGLTLALQRPILAVAGFFAVRVGGLFREGDRIEVDGIVGDVLSVSPFSTRLWEIGSKDSPLPWGGTISPLRETGRVVTVSNAIFVERPVANASADSPFIFDEFTVSVAYEADWRFAEETLRRIGKEVIDPAAHARAAEEYNRLMRGRPTTHEFLREPVVHVVLGDSWIEVRLRFLVDVRRRSATRSLLARAWLAAGEAAPEKLPNVYPRIQSQRIGGDGRVA